MEPLPRWPSLASPGWLRPYRRFDDLLPAEELERLRESLLASPYLADTTLNERFSGTRGFTVVFRRDGIDDVLRHFPDLGGYLFRVLDRSCNAFYLNPLIIRQGARVAPHRDQSLRSWVSPLEPGFPLKVSVLYVQKPAELRGGTLVLYRTGPVTRLDPRPNTLVEFLGSLRHEVTEVQGSPEELPARVSLVCEQYRVGPRILEAVPAFAVKSRRGFGDFMREALQEPPPPEGSQGAPLGPT